MRFYDLSIVDPKSNRTLKHWTSYPNGSFDPGALNVSFNVISTVEATPMGGSWITIEGVEQSLLRQPSQFNNMLVTLTGGMGAGLPLANPSQIGPLISGIAYQSFANWVGTQTGLTFFLLGDPYSQSLPGNVVLNWRAGTSLVQALKNTFAIAYPTAVVRMHIQDRALSFDEKGFYSSLNGLATMLARITAKQHPINITMTGNVITVFDDTWKPSPKQLAFTDFIGQPTWFARNEIQIRTALRGDIVVGDILEMPTQNGISTYPNLPGFVQTTAAAQPSQFNYQSAMSGKFVVNRGIRHVGNFRQPDGSAWCTLINAAPQTVDTIAAAP